MSVVDFISCGGIARDSNLYECRLPITSNPLYVPLPSCPLLSKRTSHLTTLIIQFCNSATTVVLIPGKIKTSGNLSYSFLSVQTGTGSMLG